MRTRRIGGALLALIVLGACGCGPRAARTPEELAEALRREGVAYEVAETAALPKVDARGLRLRGERLSVELYRIDDEEHRKLAGAAAALAARGQEQAGEPRPLRPVVRGPFLVIVREEPTPGQVEAALARVFRD